MDLLSWTRLGHSVAGQKEIVEIVAEQAELDSEFNPTDEDHVDRLIHSIRHALPYFSVSILF